MNKHISEGKHPQWPKKHKGNILIGCKTLSFPTSIATSCT